MSRILSILTALLILPGVLAAEEGKVVRVAVVVGNNLGATQQEELKFAESDASRMRDVLLKLAGFKEDNVYLLLGRDHDELEQALQDVEVRFEGTDAQLFFLFYFSGHSDGYHLEMNGEPVSFAVVRKWLRNTGAKVTVVVLDACHSGQLISVKGMRPGPSFDVEMEGDLRAEGTAIITSSAVGERAQESGRIRGAFFTHHLVSGLYGAADSNGDLKVSLSEVYAYAYGRTLADTLKSLAGTQHPSYSYRLEGKGGDVTLTRLTANAALLVFPRTMDGAFFVVEKDTARVVAELTVPTHNSRRLFLPAGDYRVVRRTRDRVEGTEVHLEKGQTHTIEPSTFVKADMELPGTRGSWVTRKWMVAAYYGLSAEFMRRMGALSSGGMMVMREMGPLELFGRLSFAGTSVDEQGFRYDMQVMEAAVGMLWRVGFKDVHLLAGPLVGGGLLVQNVGPGGSYTATTMSAGALMGVELKVFEPISVLAAWEGDALFFRRSGEMTNEFTLKALLGLGWEF